MDFENKTPDKMTLINNLWKSSKEGSKKKKEKAKKRITVEAYKPGVQAKRLEERVDHVDNMERQRKTNTIVNSFRGNNNGQNRPFGL